MKRLFFLFAAVAALAIGSLFLNVPAPQASVDSTHAAITAPQPATVGVAEARLSPGQTVGTLFGLGAVAFAMLGILRGDAANLSPIQSLAFASRTTSGTGTGVDLQGFDAATVVFRFETWTAGVFTAAIEESDESSANFTAVAAADLVGSPPVVDAGTEDDVEYKVGYIGSKRYIRANIVGSGSPLTAMINGAYVVRGRPHQNTGV